VAVDAWHVLLRPLFLHQVPAVCYSALLRCALPVAIPHQLKMNHARVCARWGHTASSEWLLYVHQVHLTMLLVVPALPHASYARQVGSVEHQVLLYVLPVPLERFKHCLDNSSAIFALRILTNRQLVQTRV